MVPTSSDRSNGTVPDLEIPNNVDEDAADDALVEFFRQQTQTEAPTSLERASIHQHHLSTVTAEHVVCGWGGYAAATKAQFKWMAADLKEITITGMLLQFPDFFYSMCKKNDLQETILQCMYLDWTYIAGVIRLAIIGGKSPHGDARNKSYRFGLVDVRVGNHI